MKATQAWRATCPLRIWLDGKEYGAHRDLAEEMGMHRDTLQKWMTGDAIPRMKGFAKLEELTGITAAAWMEWMASRPKVKSAG